LKGFFEGPEPEEGEKNNRNDKIRRENLLTKGLKFTNKAMKK
jgi:hypothetical protein